MKELKRKKKRNNNEELNVLFFKPEMKVNQLNKKKKTKYKRRERDINRLKNERTHIMHMDDCA